MSTYKYESKYSKMTEEERKEAKNAITRRWYRSLSPERRQKYLDMKNDYTKQYLEKKGDERNNYRHALCECCGKEYHNIYQHYQTKAHIKKITNSPKLMICN
jgi:hypothetical protein